ncbi:MAG: glycosyltransferase family 9 protein [Candidatus Omnitrophica bacterium]|nr:glycosyltransferase family 9 protein [Candidatus Omnitrophota bacterium]
MSNLGDAILTLPALEAILRQHPDSELHLIASPRTEELFRRDPRLRRVWLWRKEASPLRQAALLWKLFLARFDLVVDFRHSLIPFFLFPRRRTPLFRRRSPGIRHMAEAHLELVKSAGIPPFEGRAPLPLDEKDQRKIDRLILPQKRVVVMAPGARSHLKRYPAERFARIADRLKEEKNAQIFLVGGGEEAAISEAVAQAMNNPPVDLTGETTLGELFALLVRADLVITNDSACLHAAQAMGAPTVAIFGPTDERKYGPRLPRSAVVRRKLICAPCERALCPYHHECLRDLEEREVVEAAMQLLNGER